MLIPLLPQLVGRSATRALAWCQLPVGKVVDGPNRLLVRSCPTSPIRGLVRCVVSAWALGKGPWLPTVQEVYTV